MGKNQQSAFNLAPWQLIIAIFGVVITATGSILTSYYFGSKNGESISQQEINRLNDRIIEFRDDKKNSTQEINDIRQKYFSLKDEMINLKMENKILKQSEKQIAMGSNPKQTNVIKGDITGKGDLTNVMQGVNTGGGNITQDSSTHIDKRPRYKEVTIVKGDVGAAIPLAASANVNSLTMSLDLLKQMQQGKDIDIATASKKMFEGQIYIDSGTAVEKLSAPTPNGIFSTVKVKVLEGAHKGAKGWVSVSLIRTEERLMTE